MALRLPGSLVEDRGSATLSSIEAAVVAEKAASLGIAGRALELALARLAGAEGTAREPLIDEAAERAWNFLTQRELCGLRDREQVIADYEIPPAVMARVGIFRQKDRAIKR